MALNDNVKETAPISAEVAYSFSANILVKRINTYLFHAIIFQYLRLVGGMNPQHLVLFHWELAVFAYVQLSLIAFGKKIWIEIHSFSPSGIRRLIEAVSGHLTLILLGKGMKLHSFVLSYWESVLVVSIHMNPHHFLLSHCQSSKAAYFHSARIFLGKAWIPAHSFCRTCQCLYTTNSQGKGMTPHPFILLDRQSAMTDSCTTNGLGK